MPALGNRGITGHYAHRSQRTAVSVAFTITRLIERLEQKGLVTRQSEGKNTLVSPTESGKTLHPQIVKAVQQNALRYVETIGGGPDDLFALTKQVFSAATVFSEQ